jgi:hypothetical protein
VRKYAFDHQPKSSDVLNWLLMTGTAVARMVWS